MSESFTFTAASAGVRIDKYLTENLEGFTRSAVSRLIDDDNVVVTVQASGGTQRDRHVFGIN